jgi:hypothetical protein
VFLTPQFEFASMTDLSRRRTLATVAGLASFAGCRDSDPAPTDGGAGSRHTDTTTRPSTDPPGSTPTPELDLREANVVDVAVTEASDGYRFDVTLYHDDEGEDGYADWWQVETRDGERLGRRELLHAHGTAPFTRSATVVIPDDVTCVVVRGHDQTHGYGGRAMVVTPATGATRSVFQGSDPSAVAGSCP